MSPTSDKVRVWPLRLIAASPLMVLALAAALWFMMPASLRTVAITVATYFQDIPNDYATAAPDLELSVLQAIDAERHNNEVVISSSGYEKFATITGSTARSLMSDASRFVTGDGQIKPLAVPDSDPDYKTLRDYEASVGARIAVFALEPAAKSPVAISVVANDSVLTEVERNELKTSGTLEALRHAQRGMPGRLLPPDIQSLNSGTGGPEGSRLIYYSARRIDGHIYEVYGVYPTTADSMMMETPEVTDVDNATATANVRVFQRAATRFNGATFLVGPTDGNLVPQRLPKGLTEEQARALIESQGAISSYTGGVEEFRHAPRALSGQLGASWWSTAAFGPDTDPISSAGSSQQDQSLVFVAVYRKNPEVALMWDRVGRTPLRQAQVWVATNELVLLGVLGALFLATLAASPWALARERHLTEEAELERQRELVRREARERVIGRLTALSRQIEDAAQRSDVESREVASVARDIDETVRELKAILGDLTTKEGE